MADLVENKNIGEDKHTRWVDNGLLTFQVGEVLARKTLKLDAVLHEHRVAGEHLVIVALVKGILNVIAHVVETACTHITTCPFELVCALLHLVPVFLVEALRHLLHASRQ